MMARRDNRPSGLGNAGLGMGSGPLNRRILYITRASTADPQGNPLGPRNVSY